MDVTSLLSSSNNTDLARQLQREQEDFDSFGLPEMRDQMSVTPRRELPTNDIGVAPGLINSRETSLALALTRSTPVPPPVERQTLPINQQETLASMNNREGLAAGPTNPTEQNQGDRSRDIIMDNNELEYLTHLFNDQFNMFI